MLQTQLFEGAKRLGSGFGRESGVEVLETNGAAGFFSYFFSKKKCKEAGISGSIINAV